MAIKIESIDYDTARALGEWDKAGRWYPDKEFMIPGSFMVRSPSRRFPTSYFKHFMTSKYARLLARSNPRLYLETQGISQSSDEGKEIIAWAVENRLIR